VFEPIAENHPSRFRTISLPRRLFQWWEKLRIFTGIWVADTLKKAVSAHVYPTSLKNGRINPGTHGGEDSVLALIVAPTKNAYTANHVADYRIQLLRAAIRLAAILNAINWPQ